MARLGSPIRARAMKTHLMSQSLEDKNRNSALHGGVCLTKLSPAVAPSPLGMEFTAAVIFGLVSVTCYSYRSYSSELAPEMTEESSLVISYCLFSFLIFTDFFFSRLLSWLSDLID